MGTYSCADGYELVGEEKRTCLLVGTWTGAEPQCKVLDSLITCNGCCILPEWYCITVDVPSSSSCYSHPCLGDWPAWLGLCHHCHHHPGGGGPGGGSGRLPLETSPQRWALYSWCVVIGIASVTNFTPLAGKYSFSKANTSR